MRGRAIGLGLLGLGAFLLAGALATWLLLVPALVKLPLDQTAAPVAVGTGIDFFSIGDQKQFHGLSATVRQHVIGHADAEGAGDGVAVWEFGSTIKATDGTVLNAGSYQVCLDRRNAAAVDCPSTKVYDDTGAKLPGATVEGLTLTFPFGTGKHDYDLFNSTAGRAFPAHFKGVETLQGVEVYRFEQDIPETVLKSTDVPGAMVGSPSEPSVKADVVYTNTRTLWVEPTSGVIVTAEEHPNTVFRGPDGTTGVTYLAGTFTANEKTVADGVQRAKDTRKQINTVETVLPWTLIGLGVLALVLGGLLVRRSRSGSGAGRAEADEVENDPARVAQVQ